MVAYRKDQPSWRWSNIEIAGGNFNENLTAQGEASLDVQYTVCGQNGLRLYTIIQRMTLRKDSLMV
jgi:hypothetical protein